MFGSDFPGSEQSRGSDTHQRLFDQMRSPQGQAQFRRLFDDMHSPQGQATYRRMFDEMNTPEAQAQYQRMFDEMNGRRPAPRAPAAPGAQGAPAVQAPAPRVAPSTRKTESVYKKATAPSAPAVNTGERRSQPYSFTPSTPKPKKAEPSKKKQTKDEQPAVFIGDRKPQPYASGTASQPFKGLKDASPRKENEEAKSDTPRSPARAKKESEPRSTSKPGADTLAPEVAAEPKKEASVRPKAPRSPSPVRYAPTVSRSVRHTGKHKIAADAYWSQGAKIKALIEGCPQILQMTFGTALRLKQAFKLERHMSLDDWRLADNTTFADILDLLKKGDAYNLASVSSDTAARTAAYNAWVRAQNALNIAVVDVNYHAH